MKKNLLAYKIKLFISGLLLLAPTLNVLGPAFASATGTSFTGPSSIAGVIGSTTLASLQLAGDPASTTTVQLHVSNGQLNLTDTTSVTVNGSNPAGTLSLTGTLANLNAATSKIEYSNNNAIGNDTLEASTTGDGQVYYPTNGHVYQYVAVPGGVDWVTAKAAADASSYQGIPGYLTTITSQAENDYVAARLGGAGWMGASDSANEGTWKWVDGPESGNTFCNGDYTNAGATTCVPVTNGYTNWNGGEPNDAYNNDEADHGEDCGQFLSGGSGEWNDLPCTNSLIDGYVVEYGSTGNLPTVASKSMSITVTAATDNISSCSQLQGLSTNDQRYDTINLTQNIDCGSLTTTLFSANGFNGTLNGQGHTVSNLDIDTNGYDGSGLISYANPGAVLENLNLTGSLVSGGDCTGSLVGEAEDTDIENVSSSVPVTGSGNGEGGIIGCLGVDDDNSHQFTNISSTGSVHGDGAVGGLAGYMEVQGQGSMTAQHLFATGNVTSSAPNAGGLIGYISVDSSSDAASMIIEDAYAQGNVDAGGNDEAGGLIGYMTNSVGGSPITYDIERAYASGSVNGGDSVGGLIGYMAGAYTSYVAITLSHVFAAGAVTGSGHVGGLIGDYDSADPITDVDDHYDQNRSGQADCAGGNSLDDCAAENTSGAAPKFFFSKTNPPMSNWNFTSTWVAHANTYPTFGVFADDDSDGVSGSVEAAAPNAGDANGDGQADNEQPNVTSLVNLVTSKYAVLQSTCDQNGNVTIAPEAANASADSGYSYPAGMMNFTLVCPAHGYTATVTQYYYGTYDTSKYVLRKYNAGSGTYATVAGATLADVTIGGQAAIKVTYHITDGGTLDADGATNGQIVDPVGLALANATASSTSGSGTLTDTGFNIVLAATAAIALVGAGVAARLWPALRTKQR